MVGRIISTPLDRAKPLWEIWIVEGLEGGRLGLLLRMHHSVVDGISGAGLLMHLFDKSRTTVAPPPPFQTEPNTVPREFATARPRSTSRVGAGSHSTEPMLATSSSSPMACARA